MNEIVINNKTIQYFCPQTKLEELPVIIINTYNNEGKDIWNECNNIMSKDFILVSISKINWNNDLTPWKCPPLYKGDIECLGYADNYLKELEDDIIPIIEEYIVNRLNKKISYYGIAGLFTRRLICFIFWL